MRIRSITVGDRQRFPINRERVRWAGEFCHWAKQAVESSGYEVQTVRLATQPLSDLLRSYPAAEAITLAADLESEVAASGIDYCSLGPILATGPRDAEALIQQIPAILGTTRRLFVSVMAATSRDGISLRAVRQAAEALVKIGSLDGEGAAARRFTLSANVPPHGPFFPSAYHRGRRRGFSIALEAADLAVEAFDGARDLETAAGALQRLLLEHGGAVAAIARRLEQEHQTAFHGLDISLAPFPENRRSIAHAMERLGVGSFGTPGTLFAAAFVTGILRQTPLPKVGFSGLMIPLLEDSTMAARHSQGLFTLDSLLLYSAVCGAGLDTIPIPGDATGEQIASVYLDLCTLSVALRKPLTARLMPMKGKKAGEEVSFAFPYFAPTTVVELRGPGSGSLFGKGKSLDGLFTLGRPRSTPPRHPITTRTPP